MYSFVYVRINPSIRLKRRTPTGGGAIAHDRRMYCTLCSVLYTTQRVSSTRVNGADRITLGDDTPTPWDEFQTDFLQNVGHTQIKIVVFGDDSVEKVD